MSSSLFNIDGGSLLDQPIGIEESRIRQAKEAETRGIFQNNKRNERIARRAYREALRNKDYSKAMDAIDWLDKKSDGNGFGSGIQQAGVAMDMARNQPGMAGQDQPGSFPTSEPSLLDRKRSLFSRMSTAAKEGSDMTSFQSEAAALGVDSRHYGFGLQRAMESALGPKPSSISPSFRSRAASILLPKTRSLFENATIPL